ncbi:MAG: hypothetical protein RBT49_11860 [Bacteroidales bacterium]|jgi:hypothetical protein|nr:hypothetical protein [Bacteroidales bacterium]
MSHKLNSENITDKPRTSSEMATFYSVDIKTFNKWMRCDQLVHIKKIGYYYSIAQIKEIIQHLDTP